MKKNPETKQTQTIETETGKQFSTKGLIESNIEKLYQQEIINGTGHLIILVVGGSNTGKTSLSLLIQQYLNQDVEPGWIALDHEEWKEIHTTRENQNSLQPPKKKIVYEEGRDSFFRTNATTVKNKEAKDTLYKYRSFQNTLLINFQNASDLAPFLVLNGVADAMFRCTRPGQVEAYGQETIKQMWFNDRSRKFKGWSSKNPDFRDSFKDPEKLIPEKWEQYRKANIRKLDQGEEEEGEGETGKSLVEKLEDSASDFRMTEKRLQSLELLHGSELETSDFLEIYSSRDSVIRGLQGLRQKGFLKKKSKDYGNGNKYVLTDKGEALIEIL